MNHLLLSVYDFMRFIVFIVQIAKSHTTLPHCARISFRCIFWSRSFFASDDQGTAPDVWRHVRYPYLACAQTSSIFLSASLGYRRLDFPMAILAYFLPGEAATPARSGDRNSVRLSVRLSHACFVTKRKNILPIF